MNSREIEQLLKSEKNFIGCFAFDNLPKFPTKFPAKIIMNTGSINTEGDHWISMIMTAKACLYFDSFGLPVINQEILDWLKHKYKKLIYSDICIQSFNSNKCGVFCIAFLENVCSRKSFESFINCFSHINLFENDKMMENYLKTKVL